MKMGRWMALVMLSTSFRFRQTNGFMVPTVSRLTTLSGCRSLYSPPIRTTLRSQVVHTDNQIRTCHNDDNDDDDNDNKQNEKTLQWRPPKNILTGIDRVVCLSDLHTDHQANTDWIEQNVTGLTANDLLIVAGDVSHRLDRIRATFQTIQERTGGCRIFFVPGNHEAWITDDCRQQGIESSFDKIQRVLEVCRECNVLVDPTYVDNADDTQPLWIVPLHSWYDGSLSLDRSLDNEFCADFSRWPWTDFAKCRWTGCEPMGGCQGRIPNGVADHYHRQNEAAVRLVQDETTKRQWKRQQQHQHQHQQQQQQQQQPSLSSLQLPSQPSSSPMIISVSHFLPNQQSLPDWKDLSSTAFQSSWFDHGAPGTSAKFAKVAGSSHLQDQINRLGSTVHVFGHSHRPKDFTHDGVRYVHNPLGYGRERDMYMVSPNVSIQPLWDKTTGAVPGKQVLRLWEEQGGGLDALEARLEARGGGRRARRLL